MSKKIVTAPNSILRTRSTDFILPDQLELAIKHARNLRETLVPDHESIGVGLANPQIGKNSRLFVTFLPESSNAENTDYPGDAEANNSVLTTYFNPELIDRSNTMTFGPNPKEPILEGCLSIPGFYGPVPRHEWVTLRYLSSTQEEHTQTFRGFTARVIQHEYDHLQGILFTDYLLNNQLPLYQRNRRNQLEEVDLSLATPW